MRVTAAASGRMLLPFALIAALMLHVAVFAAGLERLSNDDAVRVLMALELTPANALEPWIWPPLHRLLLGLALEIHRDVVWVPRLLSIALALLLLVALLLLARRISPDPRVAMATALLALVSPHRLLLGSVPLSDILMLVLLVFAAERVLGWLREARMGLLLAGCAAAGLATSVRYEAWFVAACLGLMLAWQWWRGRLGFGGLAAAGVLISAFPLFWIGNSLAWYGSLANLGITSAQLRAVAGEDSWRVALWLNPLGPMLWREIAFNPALLLGIGGLALMARRDRSLRPFAVAFFGALLLLAAVMAASGSAPLAASWRLLGFWTLLTLPFGAVALVALAEAVARRLHARPGAMLALVLLPALTLPVLRDFRLMRTAMFNWETTSWRHDTEAALAAITEATRLGGGRVLVDSLGNLDFLEVMVASGKPELFVTSADAPAPEVALYVPMARQLRAEGEEELVQRYLEDRFALRRGGDAAVLAARGIRVALVRDAEARAAMDASSLAERVASWPDWTLYRLRPQGVPGTGG